MRILLKRDQNLHWLLRWSPNGRKWYLINDRQVCPIAMGHGPNAYAAFREAINRVYEGQIVEFDACYCKL